MVSNSQDETNRLLVHGHDVMQPQMQKWQDNVQSVFSALGLELDMERIEAQTQAGLANDTGAVLSAEEQVHSGGHFCNTRPG